MLIGIDLGTTVLKVIAVDSRSGALAGSSSLRMPIETDADGKREQDPARVDAALAGAIADLQCQLGQDWKRVRGIGLSAQGGSAIIVNRLTGCPLTPITLWNDARAYSFLEGLSKSKPRQWWREFSLRDEPGMGLARIRWLRERTPEYFNVNNIYAGVGEYLYFQLTGQWRQDACNALQIGCYNAVNQVLTECPLTLVDLSLEYFASMRQDHSTHPLRSDTAARFGLPRGIPVAGPYNDHEAGWQVAHGIGGHPLHVSLGTAWVGNFLLPVNCVGDSPIQLVIPGPNDQTRQVIQPLLTGNVTWDWALATFMDADYDHALTRQQAVFEQSLLPPDGLTALPWLNRANPLAPDTNGAVAIIGAGPATTRDDLLRAVAAGMVFELHRIFEPLIHARLIDKIMLSGGASKGLAFQQLIAALFAPLPVWRFEQEELISARGCLAAFGPVATDIPTLEIQPAFEHERITHQRRIYRRAFTALYAGIDSGRAYRPKPPEDE